MPSVCCAVGCDNKKGDPNISFYRLPKEEERRQRWLSAIRRANWTPTASSRLCSAHFVSCAKSQNPLSPDYVPTIFPHLSSPNKRKRVYQMARFEHTQALKRKRAVIDADRGETGKAEDRQEVDDDDQQDGGEDRQEVDDDDQQDGGEDRQEVGLAMDGSCTNASFQVTIKRLNEECMRLRTEICKLKGEVDSLTFSKESFQGKDEKVNKLTGLPSYCKLIVVFSFISPLLNVKSCLSPFQQFLLTLKRLRMNLPLFFLGHCFHTSTSTASRVFNNTLNVMYFRLCNIIRWPSRDQILISLPMCYRKNFKNCTSIIDCFEIFIERPKEMRARAQTYLQYKHHNTVKYLISITLQGVISFVSKGWGGRTSDKYVTEHSGYHELLSHGDVVLADRGFNVADSVGLVNAQLKIPAFTKGKAQLHPE
ncbi:uncharacterized protein LOC124881164 [Girardinichthys multiradiatus]|uniref:uncharacterized protein LOC124881164 n=1 Tax=Girardinichthys multiradiatus TaxID=208333 RepID=UPI001FAD0490|nr:uncharacterized protein LOC124881164 [Girardinichthys multiradiatus]